MPCMHLKGGATFLRLQVITNLGITIITPLNWLYFITHSGGWMEGRSCQAGHYYIETSCGGIHLLKSKFDFYKTSISWIMILSGNCSGLFWEVGQAAIAWDYNPRGWGYSRSYCMFDCSLTFYDFIFNDFDWPHLLWFYGCGRGRPSLRGTRNVLVGASFIIWRHEI